MRPTDPDIFSPTAPAGIVICAGSGAIVTLTVLDIATQKISHNELKRQYNETQAVKSALQMQFTTSIDGNYLRPLRNMHTDMINN